MQKIAVLAPLSTCKYNLFLAKSSLAGSKIAANFISTSTNLIHCKAINERKI